jgi:osmoprotectant transport system ATP-binding protein
VSAGSVELSEVTVAVTGHEGGTKLLLDRVSLKISPGTTTALLGRSGSGKTTLLRTVNGLVRPTGGSITVNGTRLADQSLLELRRSIGYVIQETGLFPHMTVERNAAMSLEIAGRPLRERKARAAELLQMVGLDPAQFAERMPWQLSGGQRQRVGLARALASNPSIMLLDEPFGALDPLTRTEMQKVLRDLATQLQKTMLVVTHDLAEALFLADEIVLVEGGHIAAQLPATEFMTATDPAVAEYVRAVHG